jgi:hypothetical protein
MGYRAMTPKIETSPDSTLELNSPFWGGYNYTKLSPYASLLGWLVIIAGGLLWLLGAAVITYAVDMIIDYAEFKFAGLSIDRLRPLFLIAGIVVFILSVPMIRLIPWFFSPAVEAIHTRHTDSGRHAALVIGTLIVLWCIARIALTGISVNGFNGPLDIALPVTAIIYYFAVFSALDMRLDL